MEVQCGCNGKITCTILHAVHCAAQREVAGGTAQVLAQRHPGAPAVMLADLSTSLPTAVGGRATAGAAVGCAGRHFVQQVGTVAIHGVAAASGAAAFLAPGLSAAIGAANLSAAEHGQAWQPQVLDADAQPQQVQVPQPSAGSIEVNGCPTSARADQGTCGRSVEVRAMLRGGCRALFSVAAVPHRSAFRRKLPESMSTSVCVSQQATSMLDRYPAPAPNSRYAVPAAPSSSPRRRMWPTIDACVAASCTCLPQHEAATLSYATTVQPVGAIIPPLALSHVYMCAHAWRRVHTCCRACLMENGTSVFCCCSGAPGGTSSCASAGAEHACIKAGTIAFDVAAHAAVPAALHHEIKCL